MMSTASPSTTFLLSKWIRRAIDEVDLSALTNASASAASNHPSQWPANVRNSMALCSDEFLISALRVARSLAEQISEAEDNIAERENNSDSDDEDHSLLPAPGINWADKVQVHVTSDGAANVNNGVSNNLLFSIEKADFSPDDMSYKGQSESEDGMRRIYSLGLVFYEIFSGGERPEEIEQPKGGGEESHAYKTEVIFQELSQETSEHNVDPLPPIDDVDGDSFDVANIFDDVIEDEDEYNLCNDILGDDFFNAENPRKRQTQSCHYKVYDVSVEPLKAKFLPGPLCDLVANMIDCANGNPSSEDSYHKMSEVRDDLQLMLDKPAIFLYDQDMGRAELQFGDRMFGRNAELSTIKDAYRRSAADGSEFQGKPFSALAFALDIYCGILLQDSGPSSKVAEIASKLRSSLGNEAYHLTKLIPNLASILEGPEILAINLNEDCGNAQKRLQYFLCQLLQAISSTFSAPVTLFLDDLQWADQASMEAVLQLLNTLGASSQEAKSFFFLGCCREGEIDEEHPLWNFLCTADRLSIDFTNIILDMMDEPTINTMVSETLCLSPRLTRSLSSIINHKTNGNPLFVSRLMISLGKEGLLRPSLSRRRWEWDKEKIQCRELPDDVVMFLKNSIRELPETVQLSMCTMSCFGASVDITFIQTLERAMQKTFIDDLDIAVEKGLLDKIGAQYRFSHDRIQEATYNMMKDQYRRLLHFTYGLSLASLSIDEECDGILFIAVNQLNHGGPSTVEDPSQCFIVAGMNLRAGKKAMEMSDFKLASSYLDNGISFLRTNHWTEHYNLSLEVFELAAKCALTNGDHTRVRLLYQEVVREAHSFEDKLDIEYTNIRALYSASCLEEALTKLLYVLNKLGVTLSGDLNTLLSETKSSLAEYSDEQLLSLPAMVDRTKIITMKILSLAQLCLFHTNPKSQPKATLQLVQYSLQHGMSDLTSVGFVWFGSYLACIGEITAGYRYVKIAIKLAENMNARDCMGDILAMGGQVMGYVEPLQSVNDVMIRGHEYSLMTGNISSAKLSLAGSMTCEYWSGKQLSLVKSTMDDGLRRMSSQSIFPLTQCLPLYRSALAMIGNVGDVPIALGSRADVETEEERKMTETNMHLLKISHFNKMYVGFMFRRYDQVKQLADAHDAIAALPFSAILISHCFHMFYWGLISFWVARKTGNVIWYDRGEEAVHKMRSYANFSSWNFSNKSLLLQAEQCFYLKEYESAKRCYDDAISFAKDYRFVHEEALACELAGYFLIDRGEGNSSLPYFMRAQRKYREWGASAKEESLKTFIEEQFGELTEGEAVCERPRGVTTDLRKRRAS
ncbi:putative ATPase [Skeletonema marinoi]|uniref:ATPase n=1 Tax=Skeletonema marinoi TaxID=267567 RepID=A0AAD8XX02_9STRA|nr:putative ATPase [Skeletonema marinoi]